MNKPSGMVYGVHAVRHALERHPETARVLWIQDTRQNREETGGMVKTAAALGIHVEYVGAAALDRQSGGALHQGFLLMTKPGRQGVTNLDEIIASDEASQMVLVLDSIQDPNNLGACIRTANAAGAAAVIVPKDNSVSVTPAVKKVASGGAETTPVITVTNLSRSLRELKDSGFWIVGTDDKAAKTLYEIDLTGPLAIVLGSEGSGIRQNVKKQCDFLASLPMHGIVESLNVSVTAGICLYEALRQRHHQTTRKG